MTLFPEKLEEVLPGYVKAESYRGTRREAHSQGAFDLPECMITDTRSTVVNG